MKRALALALLVAAIVAPHAAADDAAEARFWDARARAAFEARDYDRALALFLESHHAAPSPGALYNIGVAAMLAGENALAYAHFDEFLASRSTDEARRADATRRMTDMEARVARVRVTSDPDGARITVDRDELGLNGHTPRTLVLDPGPHTITVTAEGHAPETRTVEAVRGSLASVEVTLEAVLATLALDLRPAHARVVLVGGDGTELVVDPAAPRVPVGRYAARIEAEGHRPHETTIVVGADGAALRATLEPIPAETGRLLVDTGAIAARVLVDGEPRAPSPATLELEVGTHQVVVEADGYRPWRGDVEIEVGHARYLDLVLVPETP